MSMFNSVASPRVGGLVRSGMGTSICQVRTIVKHPRSGWLCEVRPLGRVHKGVWESTNYNRRTNEFWLHVHSDPTLGWHPVQVGSTCPMPQGPDWFAGDVIKYISEEQRLYRRSIGAVRIIPHPTSY